jgi:MFS family permease
VFSAFCGKAGLLLGVVLHGCSFALVFITAQIYLEQRVEPAWRARAQALMALVNGGVGNLIGYLGTGAWFSSCTDPDKTTHWPVFWSGLSMMVVVVLVYFLSAYRGRGDGTSALFPKSNQKTGTVSQDQT